MTKYLIVDDETIAHEIIEDYCSQLSNFCLIKNCYNAFDAIEVLNQETVDLIFLDINMPKVSGFELLKSLKNPPEVIVTTAYHNYAVESYDLDVVDYLLKPFNLQRFLKAINKLKKEKEIEVINDKNQEEQIFLKEGKKHYQVSIDEILFIEGYGNYNKVVTKNRTITTLEKLGTYLDLFPANRFIQVHKSYVVSLSKIDMVQNNTIYIDSYKIPVGQTYKARVTDILNKTRKSL